MAECQKKQTIRWPHGRPQPMHSGGMMQQQQQQARDAHPMVWKLHRPPGGGRCSRTVQSTAAGTAHSVTEPGDVRCEMIRILFGTDKSMWTCSEPL